MLLLSGVFDRVVVSTLVLSCAKELKKSLLFDRETPAVFISIKNINPNTVLEIIVFEVIFLFSYTIVMTLKYNLSVHFHI